MFGNDPGRFSARVLSFTNNFSNFEQQDPALLPARVWSKLFMFHVSLQSSGTAKEGESSSGGPCVRVHTDRKTGSIAFKGSLCQVNLSSSFHNDDVLQRTVKSSFRIRRMYYLSLLPLYCLAKWVSSLLLKWIEWFLSLQIFHELSIQSPVLVGSKGWRVCECVHVWVCDVAFLV